MMWNHARKTIIGFPLSLSSRLRPRCARRRIPCELLLPAQVSEEPEEHGEIHQTKMERCGEQPRRLPLLFAPISEGGAQLEGPLSDKQNGKTKQPDHHHTENQTTEKKQGTKQ